MSDNRIVIDLQQGKTTEATVDNIFQQMIRLTEQINNAKIPIVKGPNDELPEGISTGQPVIDWSSGTSQMKVWNGENLV